MTIQTVLNVTQTALVIDTSGHLLGSREPYLYDDATISPANFAILQAHLNGGRLRLLTGGVTIPSPSQGASFVSVAISGQNLVFTDSLGGTSTVAIPGGNVDLSAYVRADDLEAVPDLVLQDDLTAAVADKINSTQATTIAQTAATTATADKINAAQAGTIASTAATTAVSGVIAPIQTAVNEARKGVVDGSFGLAVGLQDAAPNTLYSTQNPAAEYDPVTNRTFIAYSATSKRQLFIRYYDHSTGQFSRRFYIKDYDLTNYEDNHGAPSLTIDQDKRRLVIFDGVHGAALRCSTSGPDLDVTTWTVRSLTAHPGTYTSVCYDPISKACYASFRRGPIHNFQSGSSQPDTHEYGSIIKSSDGGVTWTQVALINTKVVFPSDTATDFYVSDCDAFNGRIYVSFAIAHGAAHDGPRYGVHVFYYDPADNNCHSVDGQIITLTTAAAFDKTRVIAQDFCYPIKTAVNPTGDVVVGFNRYDSTANYVRTMTAKYTAGTSSWQLVDTGVISNYIFNGVNPAWRAGRWELIAIRNVTGDNVVASTGQRDNLGVSSGGGDLILLRSPDALTWTVDTTWDADRFAQPLTYTQVVRNAHPGLIALVQPVTYGVMTDKAGNAGTGDIAGYNVSNWVAEVYFIFAQTNLPAQLNIARRPEVRSWHNPNYFIHSATAGAITPPTSYTSMSVVPTPLPRGTTSVRLKVVVTGGGTAGPINLSFRGTSYRDSDDQVFSRGEWTEPMAYTVEVPVGPDGNVQWKGSFPTGTTAAVYIRSHNMGSLLLGAKTQKVLTPNPTASVAIGSATVGSGSPTATAPTDSPDFALGTSTVTTQPATATMPSNATAVQYEHKATSGSTWTVDTTSGGTSYTYTGLTGNTSYDYRAAGINSGGVGPYSVVLTQATAVSGSGDTTPPTAPTTVTATGGNASATVNASGATDAVGVTGYRVYTASTGGTAVASGTPPFTISGLTNGTPVTFYASAYDAAGNESTRTASNTVTPAAPAAGGTDGFTATSANSIPNWTIRTANAPVLVDANGAGQNGTGTTAVTNWVEAPSSIQPATANQSAKIAVGALSGTANQTPCVAVRAGLGAGTSGLGAGYWARWTGGTTNAVQLYKGAGTSLGTFALTTAPTSVEIRVTGTALSVYINGNSTASITATDSDYSTGVTWMGFRYTGTGDNSIRARSFTAADI